MADTVSIIEKLIQLALKNPNREEAASAALKAVELIEKFQIPLGSDVTIVREPSNWKPPSPDFMQTVADMMGGRKSQPIPEPGHGTSYDQTVMIQDSETSTKEDAARQRLVDAWRILREERKRLEGDVHRAELEKRERFWGFACRHCHKDNGKPWP